MIYHKLIYLFKEIYRSLASFLSLPILKDYSKITGLIHLVRLSNSLPASAMVLIGAKSVAAWSPTTPVWQDAAAMWCVTALGYISNDFNVAEDRISKPNRLLPAERLG